MNARQFTVSGSGRRRRRGVGPTSALTLGIMIEYHLEFSRATNFMVIDAAGFARAGQSLDGVTQAKQFARLCQDLPEPQNGEIRWQVRGRFDAPSGQSWLDVEARGAVRVVCQRCLETFSLTLRVSSTLGLVDTQAQLEAMDALEAEGDGPGIEYLVADPRLDVQGLVEDELILVLPYAPRHDECPGDGDVPEPPRRPSPFAVLKGFGKD